MYTIYNISHGPQFFNISVEGSDIVTGEIVVFVAAVFQVWIGHHKFF